MIISDPAPLEIMPLFPVVMVPLLVMVELTPFESMPCAADVMVPLLLMVASFPSEKMPCAADVMVPLLLMVASSSPEKMPAPPPPPRCYGAAIADDCVGAIRPNATRVACGCDSTAIGDHRASTPGV